MRRAAATDPPRATARAPAPAWANSCVLTDRVLRLYGVPPGVGGVAGVDAELLVRGEDLEGFLAKTEGLQLLSSLLVHDETVVASPIEVKARSWRCIDYSHRSI